VERSHPRSKLPFEYILSAAVTVDASAIMPKASKVDKRWRGPTKADAKQVVVARLLSRDVRPPHSHELGNEH
jgi:hypothetical protein